MKTSELSMRRSDFLWCGSIAIGAYLLYATDGCEHAPEFPQFSKGSAGAPITLRTSERQKITGTGGYYQGMFSTQLYNGSNWTITCVDVTLTKTKKYDSRRFRHFPTPSTMKPYSKGTLEATIGDFLEGTEKGDWSWDIVDVTGFRD